MSGNQLAAAIKKRVPDEAIIMITAYPETLARSGQRLEGVDLVLSKPFSMEELRQAIAKVLRVQ